MYYSLATCGKESWKMVCYFNSMCSVINTITKKFAQDNKWNILKDWALRGLYIESCGDSSSTMEH